MKLRSKNTFQLQVIFADTQVLYSSLSNFCSLVCTNLIVVLCIFFLT